ncbi:hypothetical protein J437_LFUL002819 [Ladona fulva]|uniref:GOST seven transmembrane domain-containing protein n=1 Tax=Ladona fulva TaxID=123851 RepID=A0A8K0JU14_LADFU|nr:hypothetical protein J437_LFUL002819 [Ladona fulva]
MNSVKLALHIDVMMAVSKMARQRSSIILSLVLLLSQFCAGRIHKLEIQNDVRKYIALSTFGFYEGGLLNVKLINFHAYPFKDSAVYGFSLDRTVSDAMNPYLDSHQEKCLLQEPIRHDNNGAVVYFTMDFKKKLLQVNCSKDLQTIHIYRNVSYIPALRAKRDSVVSQFSDTSLFHQRKKRDVEPETPHSPVAMPRSDRPARAPSASVTGNCELMSLPITMETRNGVNYYNTSFVMYVATKEEEGLYNLYFHSCPNYGNEEVHLDFLIEIEEKNSGNYLSAGEMPLPALYFMMAILFFLSGCFWVFILRKSKNQVFKIHYLMGLLVYLKSFSLLFHGINYHFIQTNGEHVAAWAVLYYVTHLCKGAVLFITIVLIGTGWTFIKYILSEKDKKIFMIVIPLQVPVLANVAEIIIEESEEGDLEYRTWRDLFILVDLLCCGAILFPVVWSIRHLQEASQTDGKAAINLRKLKLFRHFYIMIVCYIYFTRIIVYLLRITVPFQYEWLDAMFREMATYVFFVLTGYKFRPASANPYFQLAQDEDEEEEMDIVVTQTGLTEGLTKISRTKSSNQSPEEDKEILLSKRESSHEYD